MKWIKKHWFKLVIIANTSVACSFAFRFSTDRFVLAGVCAIAIWAMRAAWIELFFMKDEDGLEGVNDVTGK